MPAEAIAGGDVRGVAEVADVSAFFVGHLLKDRKFLIGGSTGGAGARTALEISRVGGICTLLARDGKKGEMLLRQLHGSGHSLLLGDKHGVADATQRAPYDGWFDAAGAEAIRPLSQSFDGEDVFWPNFESKLGLLAGCALRQNPILKDGGSIVFMSSVAAVRGQAGMSLYCASKSAIEGLVRAAAVELAPRRIRVNAIRAGAFGSEMHARICSRLTADQIDDYAKRHPLGFGRTEDIANTAVFLLSDAARWVTGACWALDGGYTAR